MTLKPVVKTMEALGRVSVVRDQQSAPVSIAESIRPRWTSSLRYPGCWTLLMVDASARAALALLRATTLQPLFVEIDIMPEARHHDH